MPSTSTVLNTITQTLPFQFQWNYMLYFVRVIYFLCFITIFVYLVEFSFTAVHGIASSLAFLIFVTEGIIKGGEIKEKSTAQNRKTFVIIHAFLQCVGIFLSLIGFYCLKQITSYSSLHFIFGVVALVCQLMTFSLGLLKFVQRINVNIRTIHDICGSLTFAFGIFSVATGIKKLYFFMKIHKSLLISNAIVLYLILLLFAVACLLLKENHVDLWSFSRKKREQQLLTEGVLRREDVMEDFDAELLIEQNKV